jgi:hypothetical protein
VKLVLALALASLGLVAACAQESVTPVAQSVGERPWRSGKSLGGTYAVEWRTTPEAIPLNAPFEVEVRLARADGSALPPEARVVVDAGMPHHGHGMNRAASTEPEGPGRWRARGLLLHMPGEWEVTVDVFERGVSERALFAVELEP